MSEANDKGTIQTENIYNAHKKIKGIVVLYEKANRIIESTTKRVEENWVGKGRNEFESQYNLLIKKVEDFGDTLKEIYDALVEAEAEYETADDDLRKDFVKAVEQ